MSKEGSSQSQVIASKMEHVFADDEAGVYIVADGIGDGVAADAAARLFCQTGLTN